LRCFAIMSSTACLESQPMHGPSHKIRPYGFMKYAATLIASFSLDVGHPDYLAPLLSIFGNELTEVDG